MRKRNQTATIFWTLFSLAVVLLLDARCAYAHKLKLFATAEGKIISGYAYLSGGTRLRNRSVQVCSPSGDKLGQAMTNENGEFAFSARCKCDHVLKIDTGDGHAAEFVVKADDLPDDLPAFGNSPKAGSVSAASAETKLTDDAGQLLAAKDVQRMIAKAVSKQIRPLREQLDRMEERISLRDVIGGVGYLLGVTGIAFYFLGLRRGEKPRSSAANCDNAVDVPHKDVPSQVKT